MSLIGLLFVLVVLFAALRRFHRRGGRVSALLLAFIAWKWSPERIDAKQARKRDLRDRVSSR